MTSLSGVRHPTGSDFFAAQLANLNMPAPWRQCSFNPGHVLAANNAIVFQVCIGREQPKEAMQIAVWIIVAVNTLAGFKAEARKDTP